MYIYAYTYMYTLRSLISIALLAVHSSLKALEPGRVSVRIGVRVGVRIGVYLA
jgi:hypothetical protein